MGAQQSAAAYRGGGPVKLRRRSSTAGAVTADELASAGVDISRAVAQNAVLEQQRRATQGLASSSPGLAHPVSVNPALGAPPAAQAQARKKTERVAVSTIELPPWEVVANLSEADWFALRGWIEAGWRCRKCGHLRDDHGDHPKAVRLLAACGVVPPALKFHPGMKGGMNTGSSPASSSRSGVQGPGGYGVEYASTSPDHQVGYLSDSSPSSSLTSSPMHPGARAGRRPLPAGDTSPRFRSDCPGKDSPFDDHQGALGVEACPHLSGKMPGEGTGPVSAAASTGSAGIRDGAPSGLPPRTSSGTADVVTTVGGAAGTPKVEELRLKVLQAITRAQQVYFIDKEPNGTLVFDFLLSALLDITQSGFGFISSALLKADGTPYLKTHAMSNVAWTKELRAWYAANAHKGLVFTNMNTLHGSIVLTGQPVITNDPSNDPRGRGVPPGHPPLESFMGVPLYTGTELIGIFGIANRAEGYSEALMKELEPLTMTIAQMIYAVNERKRRKEAELHLASVVQVAKEGILSLSHSGHVTSMNFSARAMFGFASDGDKKHEEVPPPPNLQFQDMVLEIDGRNDYLQHGLEHHSGHVHVGKGQRADGTIFPLEVSISRGTYDTVFFVAVVRDMSDQVETAHKLQESEERWQYQVSGIEDGVWDWNLAQQTLFFSARWFQNLGYEPSELAASIESWDSLMHPDDKERAYADLKDHLDGLTETYANEHRLKCKDGTYRWFLHRGRVVHRSGEGEPVHFVGTHSDITERKKFEDAGAIVKEATHHLLRLEAEYLARAGMDVHEPATQVVERAQQLGRTPLTEEQKGHVDVIQACGQQLVGVVRDQLEVSDIVAERLDLDYHIFATSEIVETAVLIMADRASSKGLETIIEMAQDTPLFIVSDANHCLEVVINLLSAAILETSKGFVRVRLGAEMVFPSTDDEDGLSETSSTEGGEDALFGDMAHHHLHGPQLHLVITVDGTGSSQAALTAENTLAIQTPRKLLPLLGGSLSTLIDPKRGAIYTARIPVNSSHPEYKGAMAMRAARPIHVREPLLHTRVLVVGSSQVTVAAIGKQLNAWHIPHSITSSSPEVAFLKSLPDGKLPRVIVPPGDVLPTTWPDGAPRSGLAKEYDIVILDCSSKVNLREDGQMAQVAMLLGRDRVGVVVLTRTQWREFRKGRDSANEDARALFRESDGGYWSVREPVVVHKPMVRPLALLTALEEAFRSIPGNEGLMLEKRAGDDLLLLHGFLQKSAAKRRKRTKPVVSKFKGRVLMAEHNTINVHAVELLMSTKGGVHLDSARTLADAMALMQQQPYDIVFIDLHLPDLEDPYQTIRKIRELEGQAAEVIATKQKLEKSEQEKLVAAGATECISRPLTAATLDKFFKEHLIEVKA